jgi:hypothetical protein
LLKPVRFACLKYKRNWRDSHAWQAHASGAVLRLGVTEPRTPGSPTTQDFREDQATSTGSPAALYAFAEARGKAVLCFAHVTNQMGQAGDFEKGEVNGATASLALVHAVGETWLKS